MTDYYDDYDDDERRFQILIEMGTNKRITNPFPSASFGSKGCLWRIH